MGDPDPTMGSVLGLIVDQRPLDVDASLAEVHFATRGDVRQADNHGVRYGLAFGGAVAAVGLAIVVAAIGMRPSSEQPPPVARVAPQGDQPIGLTFATGAQIFALGGAEPTEVRARSVGVAWAPDALHFATTQDDTMMIADVRGGNAVALGKGRAPAWSPDGTLIAFEDVAGRGLRAMDVHGGDTMILTTQDDHLPSWSPDGSTLAFMRFQRGSQMVMVADGSVIREVSRMRRGSSMPAPPSWSPDGSQLVVSDGDDVQIITVSTGAVRPLTVGPGFEIAPAWSPSGDRIAFVVAAGREVFTVTPSGQDLHREGIAEDPVIRLAWRGGSTAVVGGSSRGLVEALAA